jgi:RHS repeat-associated protein
MRVVHLTLGLDVGGQEKLLVEFARHADRSNFDLAFVSLTSRGAVAAKYGQPGASSSNFEDLSWLHNKKPPTLARQARPGALNACGKEGAMYDPSIGRWLEEDPIDFDGGDADLYRAMGNDPTNATDPSGCDWLTSGTAEWGVQLGAEGGVARGVAKWMMTPSPLRLQDKRLAKREKEIADAKKEGIESVKVMRRQDLVDALDKGEPYFKWVVLTNGEIRISKLKYTKEGKPNDAIPHTVASEGADEVLAAGRGKLTGPRMSTVELDALSGHYHGKVANLKYYGVPAFEKAGFIVVIVDEIPIVKK